MIEYFLDTSVLIPFFGMSINIKNIQKDFEQILENGGPELGYSDLSLLEIRFLIDRSIRKGLPEELRDEYTIGLKTLDISEQFINVGITDVDIAKLEIKFHTQYKFKDYFDRMIMASSYQTSKYLVTMDEPMKSVMNEFIDNNNKNKNNIGTNVSEFISVINWKEFMKIENTKN